MEISDIPTGNGGRRPGAGRPPGSKNRPKVEKSDLSDDSQRDEDARLYRTSRARKEAADADMSELKFKIESGQYVLRTAVVEASATALATLAQALRSVPDRLERKGLEAKFCRVVEEQIEAALTQAADMFEMMGGSEPVTIEDDEG